MENHTCCHEESPKPIRWHQRQTVLSFIGISLLTALTFLIPFLSPLRDFMGMYLRLIGGFFLLGILIGGIIDQWIPKETISRFLAGSQKRTVVRSVFLGFLMSTCSHGILAIAVALHKKGASPAAVVSFLLASPWANMAVTVLLVGLFGGKGILMILLAMGIALVTGFLFLKLSEWGWIHKNPNTQSFESPQISLSPGEEGKRGWEKGVIAGILRSSWSLLEMIVGWVTLGVVLAALIAAYVPPRFFYHWLGPTPIGLAGTMFGSTLIEVCSEGSAPLAFEIYRQTHALGNVFAFLMAGVATDITELGLVGSNLGWRVVGWILLTNIPMIYLWGLFLNRYF